MRRFVEQAAGALRGRSKLRPRNFHGPRVTVVTVQHIAHERGYRSATTMLYNLQTLHRDVPSVVDL